MYFFTFFRPQKTLLQAKRIGVIYTDLDEVEGNDNNFNAETTNDREEMEGSGVTANDNNCETESALVDGDDVNYGGETDNNGAREKLSRKRKIEDCLKMAVAFNEDIVKIRFEILQYTCM